MKKAIIQLLKILATFFLFPRLFLEICGKIAPYLPSVFEISGFFIPLFYILLIGILVFFIKNYLLYFYVAENFPFPLVRPKRIVLEGAFLNMRHPLIYSYALFLLFLGWINNYFLASAILFVLFLISSLLFFYLFNIKDLRKQFSKIYVTKFLIIPLLPRIRKVDPKSPKFGRLLAQLSVRFLIWHWCPTSYKGTENIPDYGGALFIANHMSYPDPFFISGGIHRNIRFLTTAEVFKKRINRFFFYIMGSVPIKRFTKDPTGIRKFLKLIQQGYAVGYFPEGKRSWTGEPSSFPKGVYRLLRKIHVPIIPVSTSGFYALWPRWGDHMRRAILQVRFHPPLAIFPDETEEQFRQRLTAILYQDEFKYPDQLLSVKHLNKSISTLLWRCPVCGKMDAIQERGHREFICQNCHSKGSITLNHKVKLYNSQTNTSEIYRFATLYQQVIDFPITSDTFKSQKSVLYIGNFPHIKKVDSGTLHLNNRTFIYHGSKKRIYQLSAIIQLHTEGNRILHFITNREQVQIKFQNESPLKWEQIYNTVLARSERKKFDKYP
ncbi:MAG: lysophospholipid acyltransferase family protein [Fidelibacterota bacterium]